MCALDDQTILITGSTDGLGRAPARELAGRGARVLDGVSGRYFDKTHESRANEQAYDAEARRQLWELSEELTG